MEKSNVIINMSDLPEYARTELIDFYEFLKEKHKVRSDFFVESNENPLFRFISSPIKVDRVRRLSRDQIHER